MYDLLRELHPVQTFMLPMNPRRLPFDQTNIVLQWKASSEEACMSLHIAIPNSAYPRTCSWLLRPVGSVALSACRRRARD